MASYLAGDIYPEIMFDGWIADFKRKTILGKAFAKTQKIAEIPVRAAQSIVKNPKGALKGFVASVGTGILTAGAIIATGGAAAVPLAVGVLGVGGAHGVLRAGMGRAGLQILPSHTIASKVLDAPGRISMGATYHPIQTAKGIVAGAMKTGSFDPFSLVIGGAAGGAAAAYKANIQEKQVKQPVVTVPQTAQAQASAQQVAAAQPKSSAGPALAGLAGVGALLLLL